MKSRKSRKRKKSSASPPAPDRRLGSLTRRRFLAAAGGAAVVAGAGANSGASNPARAVGTGAGEDTAPRERRAAPGRFRLGYPTYMFKEYDLEGTIGVMRRLAVRAICVRSNLLPLDAPAERVREAMARLAAAGIEVYGGGVMYFRDEAGVARGFEHIRLAGYRLVSASFPPELLGAVERHAREHDVRVAIHNHGPEDRHWPTPSAILEKVRSLDSRIGICQDTGHTIRAGRDPLEELRITASRTYDLHLKDVDAPRQGGHSIEFGRGVMDIPRFLRGLQELRYRGVVGIEYERDLRDLVPGLAESTGYTRGVIAGMG